MDEKITIKKSGWYLITSVGHSTYFDEGDVIEVSWDTNQNPHSNEAINHGSSLPVLLDYSKGLSEFEKALDPLNCIKPEWHERQQQANEVQRYIRITNATVDLGEKPIGEWVPFKPPDDSTELTEDAETIPFDPETMEIRDDGCVAYKEKDQDPPKTKYKYGGML